VSTIAGILRLDGGSVQHVDVQRLADALAHRAADEVQTYVDGPIGLAAGLWRTTPESLRERQPHHVAASGVSAAFDGRLDNRGDLLSRLGGHADLATDSTDVDILMAAYERWGADCAPELIGDFAFAIWDRRARRLCCSRDVLGLRPFFYRADAARFAWASEPHALVRYDGTTPAPNERMVGEYLTRIVDKRETLIEGVCRLPPAHTLVADAGGVRSWKYWDVDPRREIRYADDRDYVEHLRALMGEAVRAQMRSATPIGVLLSGGLDSSTVLGVARSLDPNGAVPTAYSLAIDGPENEASFFREAAAHAGARSEIFTPDLTQPLPLLEEVQRYLDIPQYPNALVAMPLRARAQADGVRVLLTGLGPDEFLRGSRHHYADQLRRGQLLALVSGMRLDARVDDFAGWRRTLRMTLWPMLRPATQERLSRLLRRRRFPAWINPRFARRIGLADRLARAVPDPGFTTHAQYDMYRIGLDGWMVHGFELLERSSAPYGIETRHPFFDRRIIEFGLALPESVRWRDGQAKHLLRRAAEPYVPVTIARRLTSPDYSRILASTLEAHGGAALFRSLHIARHGWVDGPRVAALYDDMTRRFAAGESRYTRNLWSLWMVFVMELWFTSAIAGKIGASGGRDE
jgi:asparagine synthase (glutamine-hydrolysing)